MLDPRRRNHLTASALPKIMKDGSGRYISEFGDEQAVYNWYIFGVQQEAGPEAALGHMMEPGLTEHAIRHWGLETGVHGKSEQVFQISRREPIMACTHDILPVGLWNGLRVNVELKTVWSEQRAEQLGHEADEIFDDWKVQTAGQQYVGELDATLLLVAVIPKREMRYYVLQTDSSLCDQLVSLGIAWWNRHIVPRVSPDGCTLPPLSYLKSLRRDEGSVIELPDYVQEAWLEMKDVAAERLAATKQCQEREDELKRVILGAMGDASAGSMPNGNVLRWAMQNSSPSGVRGGGYEGLRRDGLFEQYFEQGQHGVLREKRSR